MNRKDFIQRVTAQLRENNVRKSVTMPKQVFHISDDSGNSRDFIVRTTDKSVLFTKDDIDAIVDACLFIIQESLKAGEKITFHGFGTLGIKYRQPRATKSFETGEWIGVDGRYVPKFSAGKDLKMCAKIYELSLENRDNLNSGESEGLGDE